MLNTPLQKLRKEAPGSLTAAKIVKLLGRRGLKRALTTVTAFERAQIVEVDPLFEELYAEIIGQPVEAVREAHRRTLRMRQRAQGPFDCRSVA